MRHRLSISVMAVAAVVGGWLFMAHPVSAAETGATPEQVVQGTLTSLSGIVMPASLTVQVDTTSYTVNVSEKTSLVRRFRGPSSLEEFGVGDVLRIRGMISGSTITASYIRNVSIQRVGGIFIGVIESINDTNDTFVLDPRGVRDDQTVTTTASTKIFFGHRKMTFDDLAVGQKVRVVGIWRRSSDTIAADRVHVNLSTVEGSVKAINCTAKTMTVEQRKKTWSIAITDDTSFMDKRGQNILCASVAAGHKVHVRGVKTGSSTVTALAVRDHSVGKIVSLMNGSIQSIDLDTNTLVVKNQRKNGTSYTVTVTPTSIIVDETGALITLSSLMVGDDVQLRGVFNGTNVTLNLLIDKDLP